MKSLIEKLVQVQTELKAPKSQRNTFGNYNYRKAEDILEAAKPLLKDKGLLLSLSDDIVLIGDRFYVKVTATITDGENNHSVTALAREEETKKGMDGSQITGASSSYARKYALNGLFAIDDTADSDQTNDGKGDQKQSAQAATTSKSNQPKLTPSNETVWKKVVDGMKNVGRTQSDWPGIKSNYDITPADEKKLFAEMGWS